MIWASSYFQKIILYMSLLVACFFSILWSRCNACGCCIQGHGWLVRWQVWTWGGGKYGFQEKISCQSGRQQGNGVTKEYRSAVMRAWKLDRMFLIGLRLRWREFFKDRRGWVVQPLLSELSSKQKVVNQLYSKWWSSPQEGITYEITKLRHNPDYIR